MNHGRSTINLSTHINPLMINGFTHHYHLGESTFIFRVLRYDFKILLFPFFDEIPLSKQNSTRWDATLFGITSMMSHTVCLCPIQRMSGLNGLRRVIYFLYQKCRIKTFYKRFVNCAEIYTDNSVLEGF